MFPNPQDALPLPSRPSLERYKKLAKELVTACKSAHPDAILDWSEKWVEALVRLSGGKFTRNLPAQPQRWIDQVEEFARRKMSSGARNCALTNAQFVIARSHGFKSWPKLAQHLQQLERSTHVSRFEAAADAIVSGDIATLKRLLKEEPELVRACSTREHGATLLHYVSANGVEGYRQKTPKNIMQITELLLDAGAEVDATCYVYGGDCTTLGLAATSVHPAKAGVMNELLQFLLDRGAYMDRNGSAGRAHSLVFACLANGQPGAAHFLASKGAPLDFVSAAALDHIDIVKEKFNPDNTRTPDLSRELMQEAFRYACGYGANRVVEFLLERGADLAEHSGDGQTGLHYAVIFGRLETVKLLLRHKPPLEAKNIYGGTVLGQTLWSAGHGGNPDIYIAILEALVAAGAKVPERHTPVNTHIDAWMAQHGSHADPSWYWYGEKPRRMR